MRLLVLVVIGMAKQSRPKRLALFHVFRKYVGLLLGFGHPVLQIMGRSCR